MIQKNIDRELEIFIENIIYLKEAHDLSDKEMAQICKISHSSLLKLQKGIIPNISCNIIFRLAKHFGLAPTDLFSPISKNK